MEMLMTTITGSRNTAERWKKLCPSPPPLITPSQHNVDTAVFFRRGDGSDTMNAMDVAQDAARGQDGGSAHAAILNIMEER